MEKKFLPFVLIGIVVLIIVVGFFVFKGKLQKGSYQVPGTSGYKVPESYEAPKVEGGNFKIIPGIGFKKESWLEYKLEGYGVSLMGGKETPRVFKALVKLISLPIGGKEYIGIEMDSDELMGGMMFAMVFNKETGESLYLAKGKGMPTQCLKEKFMEGFVGGLPDVAFSDENLEKEYKVDLSEWNFVGEEEITLESGRKIKVAKFKKEGVFENEKIINELWLSGEVPIYFVMFKEKIGTVERSIMLSNFGMDGGLPNFTEEDLKSCSKELSGLPEFYPDFLGSSLGVAKMFCQTDTDCVCGVDKETGKCAFGNKEFIDTSKQCPDFCTGIGGQFTIKCVRNVCTPVAR
ncbi:MAG: hypothetical protein QXO40_04130 [Candidatus Aenigmatarchaeota archaeon]